MKIQVDTYFDGNRLHTNGPFVLEIEQAHYRTIVQGRDPDADCHAGFLMPAAVESHAHLFLDGDELDPLKRSDYLKRPREQLLDCATANVERYRKAGITVIRDAGDIHGINQELRDNVADTGIRIIAAGSGLRKAKRYGSFFAQEVETYDSLAAAVSARAKKSDEIKIVLTGIIDFENGVVKGEPQFTLAETQDIVTTAHDFGLRVFAHCSGLDGLRIAVTAGVDSIEHGFFMNQEILEVMAAKKMAWTPTLLPVHVQWAHPEYCGWNPSTVDKLQSILDNQAQMLVEAEAKGVMILAGSDAGSYGVRHAEGLLAEVALLRRAGLRTETALCSVTSVPRKHFGLPTRLVEPGQTAEYRIFEDGLDAVFCTENRYFKAWTSNSDTRDSGRRTT